MLLDLGTLSTLPFINVDQNWTRHLSDPNSSFFSKSGMLNILYRVQTLVTGTVFTRASDVVLTLVYHIFIGMAVNSVKKL
jgi:hypothetical protein